MELAPIGAPIGRPVAGSGCAPDAPKSSIQWIEKIMSLIPGNWLLTKDGDPAARSIFQRHYTWHEYKDRRPHKIFVGPGYKLVLVLADYSALFIWRKFIDKSGQKGINCSVFRNESSILSSLLILEAEQIAWQIWPGERLRDQFNGLGGSVHADLFRQGEYQHDYGGGFGIVGGG